MNSYVPLLVMIAAAAVFPIGGFAMNSFLGSKRHNWVKLENYECDVETTPAASGRGRFPIKHYLTAITLVVFNIEVVFLYPQAVSFHRPDLFGVVTMLSFVFLIAVPSVHEWCRGGLK